jgi:hypothetical protein
MQGRSVVIYLKQTKEIVLWQKIMTRMMTNIRATTVTETAMVGKQGSVAHCVSTQEVETAVLVTPWTYKRRQLNVRT